MYKLKIFIIDVLIYHILLNFISVAGLYCNRAQLIYQFVRPRSIITIKDDEVK